MTTNLDDDLGLTGPQELALAAILRGATITDAAKEAGVTRQAVSTWRNRDPEFMAALARGRRDVWEGTEDRLRRLMQKALDRIEADLDRNTDQTGTALKVLGLVGVPNLRPIGETDAATIASDQMLADTLNMSLSTHSKY